MFLTDLTILGETLPVDVATDGTFSATFESVTYDANSLLGLTRKLERAISTFQGAVPFVLPNGKLGEMHGYGPSGDTMLVIWTENGRRDAIPVGEAVFPPEAATVEVLAELESLRATIKTAKDREDVLLLATVQASVLYEQVRPTG